MIETIFLLGADELDMSNLKSSFIIYQGSHGDAGAHAADVILPGASYAEKTGIYVNLEGRVQIGIPAINPKGLSSSLFLVEGTYPFPVLIINSI